LGLVLAAAAAANGAALTVLSLKYLLVGTIAYSPLGTDKWSGIFQNPFRVGFAAAEYYTTGYLRGQCSNPTRNSFSKIGSSS
jgi:hypothetical protein